MLLFKALSALLSYPTSQTRDALPEIAAVLRSSMELQDGERNALLELVDELGRGELLAAEERYVDLFDRGRALSLNLFEHLHGEGRDRGAAMVELKQLYAEAGFDLSRQELPDYLPVILEYLSYRSPTEAREMLSDCAHIISAITRSLLARRSKYASVLQALLVFAGESSIDPAKIPPVHERTESLDREWMDQPAFANNATSGGSHAR
jgi:nitrate reductase delta subunit